MCIVLQCDFCISMFETLSDCLRICHSFCKHSKFTDDNKADDWQKDFVQWCKKSVKELENINKKIDNINEKDDIAVSAEKQKKEHDERAAAIWNDLDFL